MIALSILDNSIIHAHTYVIVVLCVPVATHGHLPSVNIKSFPIGSAWGQKTRWIQNI